MKNLNSVLIEGNLTHDPESKMLESGNELCKFSLACNRSYKAQDQVREEVSYFPVEVWGDRAQPCMRYLQKGKRVRVIGRLKQDRWKTEEGMHREKTTIVAEHVEFGPSGKKHADLEKAVKEAASDF